jgi:hypothetical protein
MKISKKMICFISRAEKNYIFCRYLKITDSRRESCMKFPYEIIYSSVFKNDGSLFSYSSFVLKKHIFLKTLSLNLFQSFSETATYGSRIKKSVKTENKIRLEHDF